MAIHVVVNPDIMTNTKYEKAYLDVSCEPMVANVTYTVYTDTGASAPKIATMNNQNFATSPDLFGMSHGKTALVVAVTSDQSVPSAASLRQVNGSTKVGLTVPPASKAQGTAFNFPLGDITGGASLYIGNANSVAANVVVQFGQSSAPAANTVTVPAFGVVKIALTHSSTNLIVTVTNNVAVVVQVVIAAYMELVIPVG